MEEGEEGEEEEEGRSYGGGDRGHIGYVQEMLKSMNLAIRRSIETWPRFYSLVRQSSLDNG